MSQCEKCIHQRICDIWRAQECQSALCFVDDCFEPKIDTEELLIVRELRENLARYEQAEQERRLVKLPCKVGDNVFSIRADTKQIYECEVAGFIVTDIDLYIKKFIFDDNRISISPVSEFCKTIFLTREEAEVALKGMENDGKIDEC